MKAKKAARRDHPQDLVSAFDSMYGQLESLTPNNHREFYKEYLSLRQKWDSERKKADEVKVLRISKRIREIEAKLGIMTKAKEEEKRAAKPPPSEDQEYSEQLLSYVNAESEEVEERAKRIASCQQKIRTVNGIYKEIYEIIVEQTTSMQTIEDHITKAQKNVSKANVQLAKLAARNSAHGFVWRHWKPIMLLMIIALCALRLIL
eukprot:TRINITY_DN2254_c0_g1_i11.p1 TRINITY_DN2254_c0_g1~~TRINITY_DN2254_c0_g1_i11.p1  ORF type:complete len:205 (+),score=40.20 TRINITY_DN2254_c0_g1_i11:148-762(+)